MKNFIKNTSLKAYANYHMASFIGILVVFYLFFNFNYYAIFALIIGILIVSFTTWVNRNSVKASQFIPLSIVALGILYFAPEDKNFVSAILIGANLTVYYFFHTRFAKDFGELENNSKIFSINLFNSLILLGLILKSGLEKFRGANKILDENYLIFIIILILISICYYFFSKFLLESFSYLLKKKIYLIWCLTAFLSLALWAVSYFYFKEIGMEKILIPILSGLIAGATLTFFKPNSLLVDINEIVLITIVPFQSTGLVGIVLAYVISAFYAYSTSSILGIETPDRRNTLYKLAPILFLVSAAEIRENAGLISKFSIASGYQIGWILLGALAIEYSLKYFQKLIEILKNNEVVSTFPFLASFFTLLVIAIIIRFSKDESLAGIILATSLYLFFTSQVEAKNKELSFQYVSSLSGAVGSMAFLVLTAI